MKRELIVHENPKSPISEVFRTLRANIQFMNSKKNARLILITSTFPDEGKSWISSNLAIAFAQAGKTVLLIDADMRKGRQYNIFGVSPKPGLSNYLSGIGLDIEDEREIYNEENYIQETEVENLYIITAGDIPPNPSELLISSRTSKLLKKLKEKFDIIIIDGTPCELVTDSLVLIRSVDATIVVAAYKQTKKDNLRKVIESIKDVGGKNIGLVFNKIPISSKKYEEAYYYGSKKSKNKSNNYVYDDFKSLSREKEIKVQRQMNETKGKRMPENHKSKEINSNNANRRKREVSKERKEEILKQMNEFIEKDI